MVKGLKLCTHRSRLRHTAAHAATRGAAREPGTSATRSSREAEAPRLAEAPRSSTHSGGSRCELVWRRWNQLCLSFVGLLGLVEVVTYHNMIFASHSVVQVSQPSGIVPSGGNSDKSLSEANGAAASSTKRSRPPPRIFVPRATSSLPPLQDSTSAPGAKQSRIGFKSEDTRPPEVDSSAGVAASEDWTAPTIERSAVADATEADVQPPSAAAAPGGSTAVEGVEDEQAAEAGLSQAESEDVDVEDVRIIPTKKFSVEGTESREQKLKYWEYKRAVVKNKHSAARGRQERKPKGQSARWRQERKPKGQEGHRAPRSRNKRMKNPIAQVEDISIRSGTFTENILGEVEPLQALFPFVERVQAIAGCCIVLAAGVRVTLEGAAQASPLLARAAGRTELALRRLQGSARAQRFAGVAHNLSIVEVMLQTPALNETLTEETDVSYSLRCTAAKCVVAAQGIYGAVSALQSTLLQLFIQGGLRYQALELHDQPGFRIRGLMIDTGRRFVPKDILFKQVIDGMALMRMNLLQLHLSDFCRFALDLPGFPELNRSGLHAGQYSLQDVQDIVAYARDRAIMVLPEVDLPGHTGGLLPLESRGLRFCKPEEDKPRPEQAAKLYDDPEGHTREVVRSLLTKTAAAFGKQGLRWMHVGGDEADPTGECTLENIANLEGFAVREVVHRELRQTAVAWEELRLKGDETLGRRAAGGTNATIVMGWHKGTPAGIVGRGHRAIAADMRHHYLDFSYRKQPAEHFWYDLRKRHSSDAGICAQPTWEMHEDSFLGGIADDEATSESLEEAQRRCAALSFRCAGVTCQHGRQGQFDCSARAGEPFLGDSVDETSWVKRCPDDGSSLKERLQSGLLGSISAMWTDRYTYVYQCGAAHASWGGSTGTLPTGALMYPREFDESFGPSLAGMIWPRAAIGAGSVWRYNNSMRGSAVPKQAAWLAALLRDVGNVSSCPPGCDCDELSACGRPYPVLRTGHGANESWLQSCFAPATRALLGEVIGLWNRSHSREDALRLCFWRGVACGGIGCSINPDLVADTHGSPAETCKLRGPEKRSAGRDGRQEERETQLFVKVQEGEKCAPDVALWGAAPPTVSRGARKPESKRKSEMETEDSEICVRWTAHVGKFLGEFSWPGSRGTGNLRNLAQAKARCIGIERRDCRGVTCEGDPLTTCTTRVGRPFLQPSQLSEVSYVWEPC